MVVFSFLWESLGFLLKKNLDMLVIFFEDGFKVFILICFYGPFLGKVGSVDNDFVFFLFFYSGKLAVYVIGHLH